MPDPTVRFAAGRPDKPRSSVWRLWVHHSDVYLTARILAATFKLSMHESGEWISAFTKESGAVVAETGSRRQFEWHRPPEFTPGWTQDASVMIPWVSWRDQIPIREPAPADTEWVPQPKRNKKLVFQLLLSAAGVEEDVRAVLRPGDGGLTRSLPLHNGEALWLAIRQQEMAPDESQWIQRESGKIRAHLTGSADDFIESTNVATVVFTSELGEPPIPVFVQVPLGRQHLAAAGPEG